MPPARWQQIQQVYLDALDTEPGQRGAFLTAACGSDAELRREVEALLNAHDDAGTFLQAPASAVAAEARNHHEDATLLSPLGQRVNQYQILARLGAGGMGEVWLAEDTNLHRNVALKLLPAAFTNDRERVRRFAQEARAASALNHPNIITIHDLSEADSGCFIVMEHVAGQTLRALSAAPIATESLLHWGRQIAKALHAAHAANIIHRDIKPANIMVRDDGYVKVLDFGLAKLTEERRGDTATRRRGEDDSTLLAASPHPPSAVSHSTTPGTVMGTVKYMSPEQTRGEVVTTASDIFAFGIVLYELATGQHPFQGATLYAVMQAITTSTPVAPSQFNPALPAALNALVLQMLAKDAAARPSAQEVAARLAEIARGSESAPKPITDHRPPTPIRHTVGRIPERHELRAAFNAANNGRSSLLCIAGEPGIGKTTLVEDWLSELAAAESCTIARGRCSERLAGTEAYLPLLEALETLLQHSDATAAQMRQLAPTWYAQVASLSHDDTDAQKLLAEVKAASQERMKRELAAFLTAVAQAQPLVIFFDDLHWADVSTIDLLNFLAGKFAALRVLIVVTYRPSDMLLAKHPFLQIRPDLQARGLCRELLLEFLNEAEIAEYLALEFPDNRFPPAFPTLIHAKTEGSPLFMADLVRYLRDRSVIAQTSGGWALEQTLPDIERELPESVRGMIERKIAQLNEDDLKLLTCASVQGYEFDSAVVAQVLNLDAEEVEERLEKLERVFAFVKLVSEAEFPNGPLTLKYRFVHVLYQNTLYGTLRVTRKASWSAAVAQSLLNFYGEQHRTAAAQLAHLLETARDFQRATECYLLAAQNAAQVFAYQEAALLASRGLELLKSLPTALERNRLELNLQTTLSIALMVMKGSQSAEVERAHTRAKELGQQLGETQQLYIALFGLWYMNLVKAELQTAREMGEQLFALAQELQDPVHLLVAHRVLGQTLLFLGEFAQARTHQEQGIALYEPQRHRALSFLYGQDPGVACHLWATLTLELLGYPSQAQQRRQEAVALTQELAHSYSLAYFLSFICWQDYFRQDELAILAQVEKTIALSQEHGFALYVLHGTFWQAWVQAKQGQPEESLAQMQQSLTTLRKIGANIWLPYFYALLATSYGEAQQAEEGLRVLADALAEVQQTRQQQYEAELHRLKGELLLLLPAQQQTAAAASFHQAIEIAQKQQAKSLELRATMSLARLWQRQGKIAEAQQRLAEIYGWFTEGFDTADLQEAKALLAELH